MSIRSTPSVGYRRQLPPSRGSLSAAVKILRKPFGKVCNATDFGQLNTVNSFDQAGSLPLVRGGGPPQVVEGIAPQAKLTFYSFTKKVSFRTVNPLSRGASTLTAPAFQGEPFSGISGWTMPFKTGCISEIVVIRVAGEK